MIYKELLHAVFALKTPQRGSLEVAISVMSSDWSSTKAMDRWKVYFSGLT